ncbi:MAG: hypothetical protein V1749_07705 [Candidatus Desantisbacteria bacterium]
MKVYLGIRESKSHIYISAVNSQGKTILKTYFPSICPTQAIINSLEAFQQAFGAPLRIATCLEENLQQSLLAPLQKKFPFVRPYDASVFYLTDFFPEEEPYAPTDPYRDTILLAILDSLEQ